MSPLMPALAAAAVSAVGTPLCILLARATGFMSHPNPLVKHHRDSVPYLGGVAVAFAAILGVVSFGSATARLLLAPSAHVAAFLVLGLLDDRRAFTPGPKFALQLAVACSSAWWCAPGHSPLELVLHAGAVLFFVNAANFLDVGDGLLAGTAALMFAAAGDWSPWSLPAAGACFGFLIWNRPPARIFLGDAGSHAIGYLLAVAALQHAGDGGWLHAAPGLLVWGSVLLFETAFITVMRMRRGIPFWKGSPDHLALRLRAHGWSAHGVCAVVWCAALVSSAGARAMDVTMPAAAWGSLAIAAAVAAWFWGRLSGMEP